METRRRNRADLCSGAVLALLGLYIVLEARRWEYLGPEGPGAGFFPLWYGLGILLLAGVLIAGALRRSAADTRIDWSSSGRAFAAWAALAVAIVSFVLVGFVVGFALFCWFMAAVMYRRPFGASAAIAAGSAIGFYLLFSVALGVALPAGLFGF
jgi:putative tricarboxylic transport membrane protein